MHRRSFLKNAGLVSAWVGVSVMIQSCGSDDDPTGISSGGAGDVSGSIASNHGHSVKITKAQIDAAGAVTLNLSGGTHSHQVSLDAGQVVSIGAGTKVIVGSTVSDGHPHQVTFN